MVSVGKIRMWPVGLERRQRRVGGAHPDKLDRGVDPRTHTCVLCKGHAKKIRREGGLK